jgi:uncharacterized protein (TIGR02611 family)
MAFYITTFAQLFFSFACRSQRYTLPQLGAFTNPYLFAAIAISGLLQMSLLWFPLTRNVFFKTAPQFGSDWLAIFLLALAPVSLVEITKIVRARHRRKGLAHDSIVRTQQLHRNNRSPVWRRVVVFFLGGVILAVGLVMLVLPGPAIIFIPLGLAILATEFRWARKWLSTARQWLRGRFKKIRLKSTN